MTQSDKTSTPTESWLASRPQRADLSRYLDMIRSHWLLLVAFLAAGLVAAFAYVSVAHKTYQAEADLLVTPVAADDPNLIGLPLVRETADPTADVLTVAKLVDSPSVASLVAQQLGGNPIALLNHITATPVTQSEIIAVDATASTPAEATRLADAFAQQTVQARTNAMHAQLATLIPTLKATAHTLKGSESAGIASQLAVLETLQASPDPTVRVSSTATPPTSPASPNKKLSLAGGGFAGLVIGLLVVLTMNALDPKLRDEDQLREIYDLPLLARVPKQRSGKSPLTPKELTPPVSEAFRTLRAGFTVRQANKGRGKTRRGSAILVTGDAASQGKTTVALNLAMSLVAAGKQVIMIESDLRRPSIGEALGVRAPRGLAEVLLGKTQLVEALVWIRAHGPQLELLLATTADLREIDRISADSARKLVREARTMCDFVVIDSPPMTEVTDALAFAEEADDVLLVARVGNSHVRKMSDLGELLTRQGIVPTGVVLVGASESGGYYYYRNGGEQHVFAGLLRRRADEDNTIPAEPHLTGDSAHENGTNGANHKPRKRTPRATPEEPAPVATVEEPAPVATAEEPTPAKTAEEPAPVAAADAPKTTDTPTNKPPAKPKSNTN
jgi:capsular exopolysaccharide synthesis family protein